MAEYARNLTLGRRRPVFGYCQVQRDRENFTKFKTLIAVPGNLVSGVSLPADADIFIASSSLLAVTTLLVDAVSSEGTRAMGSPARPAADPYHIGRLYRATNVTKHASAPGTVSVYVRNGMGKLFLIAQG